MSHSAAECRDERCIGWCDNCGCCHFPVDRGPAICGNPDCRANIGWCTYPLCGRPDHVAGVPVDSEEKETPK